jgi:hypothetical protein
LRFSFLGLQFVCFSDFYSFNNSSFLSFIVFLMSLSYFWVFFESTQLFLFIYFEFVQVFMYVLFNLLMIIVIVVLSLLSEISSIIIRTWVWTQSFALCMQILYSWIMLPTLFALIIYLIKSHIYAWFSQNWELLFYSYWGSWDDSNVPPCWALLVEMWFHEFFA